ncbi:hypothetical protein GLOIN_2v1869978 [Rhizophagus irregularis DAOM 181602=DAOM 197198]|nr:hypothetical protein GLOIN_2v1869978 [Rhizophagus irregularis DAOM 181602=DAOM 197198]
MGDFNLISNGHIDCTPLQHISKPKFFNDIETMCLIDSYRKLNKEVPGNTYHREDVSTRIDQIWISENLNQEVIEDKVNITEYSQEDIDRYWDKLNSFIVNAADSELPKKVIRLHNTFICYNKKKTTPEPDYKKFKATETKAIRDKIEKRVEITQKDQTTWLSSILDRNTLANIVIDKVLVNEKSEGSTKRLATEPGEVKEAVDNKFVSMFRKRNTLQNSLMPLWQQIYEPAGKFKEEMEATIEKVTMEEWNNTVKELIKNLTAGLSGINYKIILQLPEELVILLDMKKALYSVGLEVPNRTLLYIDIPASLVEWIIALFKYRFLRIATAYGLRIQQTKDRRYEMKVTWPNDINDPTTWIHYRLQVPVCAYMDDTVFLESSKSRMQKIVDIVNDFYLINDTDINVKKSEMIIINPSVKRHDQIIKLGHDRSIVQTTNNEIRYLGIWFSNKPSRRRWMQRLSTTVKNFCDTVRKKFVPAGQCIYLINRVLIPRLIYIAKS